MLFREHPRSTSRAMAEDAKLLHMPKEGGAGKTIVVVGGGISGLSTAKYLLQAGYKIELIEEIGPRPLVEELKKWEKMDCYVILHSDFSSIGKMPWVHQTYTNKKTGKYYIQTL